MHAYRYTFLPPSAFHSACVIQPVMINENTVDADFNSLVGEDERAIKFKYSVYRN